jgi:transmembrane sensor
MNEEHQISDPVVDNASVWLARRDRGLTPAEQDAYLQWLAENPAHGRAIARLEKAWGFMDRLEQWRPAHSARPNPDLLLSRRSGNAKADGKHHSRRMWFLSGALAAAAAIAVAWVWQPFGQPLITADAAPTAKLVRNSEVRKLADGSTVELHKGSDIAVDFSGVERRVRLLGGEAHFTVAKNKERPFIVDAGGVAVRALGTAFNVKLQPEAVEVLVTEGTVRVDQPAVSVDPIVPALTVGERTSVSLTPVPTAALPEVIRVNEIEMERRLAWQGLRIEFNESPLVEAVAEFNRHSGGPRIDLAPGAQELEQMKIGGNFRADNVEAFVRLLESGFGVAAERTATGRILLRAQQ